jgi:hypothetical protein
MLIPPQTRVPVWIILLAIWLAGSLTPPQAAGQEPKKAKWEYCKFTIIGNKGTNKVRWTLTTGKEKVEAASLKDLGEKLKMKDSPTVNLAVLDHLGEDGWELVSYTANETPMFSNDAYMLKRKR